MALTEKDILYIAHLARLDINDQDLDKYTQDLNNILDKVAEMNAVNTDTIEPMAHPLDLPQPLREDKVTETDQHQLFQSIAPLVEQDLYLVPKVIEEVE